MNRRKLLSAAPAALALGTAGATMATPVVTNPDAELIQLCAAFDKLTAEYNATNFDTLVNTPEGDAAEAEQQRISDQQDPLVDQICALQASTLAGFLALARSLTRWTGEIAKPDEAYCFVDARLTAALLRSMTGRA